MESPPDYSDSHSIYALSEEGASTNTEPDFIVAIDFGTTFTGIAYIHSAPLIKQSLTLQEIAGRIKIVQRWNGITQGSTDKVPTMLSYDSNGELQDWGPEVLDTEDITIKYFKLGLQDDVDRGYLSGNGSAIGGFLSKSDWTHNKLSNKSSLDFASEYLSAIHAYFLNDYVPGIYGPAFLQGQRVSYVITVPAIWTHKAKDLTRKAAERAGITDLEFVTEPQAAALYCATISKEVDLRVGDRFLVCDAGGGTVDLISYTVKNQDPLSITECTAGTGGTCGATFLDHEFIQMLRRKLGSQGDSILTPELVAHLQDKFEYGLKRGFNENARRREYVIDMGRAPDIPRIGLRSGKLKVTTDDMKGVFGPIFRKILVFVKQQMSSIESLEMDSKVKTIFLVGGLGSNAYLKKFLERELLGTGVTLIQPDFAQTAVARGGVVHRLGLDLVSGHIARRNFGIDKAIPFEFDVHPPSRMIVGPDGVLRCREVMHWYIKKGQKLANDEVIKYTVYSQLNEWRYRNATVLNCTVPLLVNDDDDPPKYLETSVKPFCEVQVNLKDLPEEAFERVTGSDGIFYSITYDLAIKFGQMLEFQMIYNGQECRKVTANYH